MGSALHMTHGRNLITDVPGLRVGNADNARLMSGVTVLLADRPMTAAVDVRGGGPGTRETDVLGLAGTVTEAHAIVLSGGSAFGLGAATGVQCWLAERGLGFAVGSARVPIVPQAILFDLLNGGDKDWGTSPPYEQLGRDACAAARHDFALGSAGAGYGAACANLRGGLGSASEFLDGGAVVGAVVAVNPLGTVTLGDTPHFWAATFERGSEFGGLGVPQPLPSNGARGSAERRSDGKHDHRHRRHECAAVQERMSPPCRDGTNRIGPRHLSCAHPSRRRCGICRLSRRGGS